MEKWENKKTEDLIEAILALESGKEAKKFLRDLLTEREIIEFGNRWKAARMLSEKISYPKIQTETGLSSRTIARISNWLKNGKGGYQLVLNRIKHHDSIQTGRGLS
ncbi:MAG: YerC/YecD family TrpR-related protein [bacterium]|nr:YerC/YecD family TrpR-related protein [bacterium]